jgi:hypothetical protein
LTNGSYIVPIGSSACPSRDQVTPSSPSNPTRRCQARCAVPVRSRASELACRCHPRTSQPVRRDGECPANCVGIDLKDVMSSTSAPTCRDLLSSSAARVRVGVQTVELEEALCEHRNGTGSASRTDHWRVD